MSHVTAYVLMCMWCSRTWWGIASCAAKSAAETNHASCCRSTAVILFNGAWGGEQGPAACQHLVGDGVLCRKERRKHHRSQLIPKPIGRHPSRRQQPFEPRQRALAASVGVDCRGAKEAGGRAGAALALDGAVGEVREGVGQGRRLQAVLVRREPAASSNFETLSWNP